MGPWIFYLLIALFFGYLLFDAFGKPVGRTKPEPRKERKQVESSGDAVDRDTYEPYAYTGKSDEPSFKLDEKLISPGADRALIEAGLIDIMDVDPSFDVEAFVPRAAKALEIVLGAYQARDREDLQMLLEPDLYEAFEGAITVAEKAEDNSRLELIGLGEPRFIDAKMEDTLAVITLSARLEQLIAKREEEGKDVEGLGETVIETSEYTFVRDVNSGQRRWLLRSIEDA